MCGQKKQKPALGWRSTATEHTPVTCSAHLIYPRHAGLPARAMHLGCAWHPVHGRSTMHTWAGSPQAESSKAPLQHPAPQPVLAWPLCPSTLHCISFSSTPAWKSPPRFPKTNTCESLSYRNTSGLQLCAQLHSPSAPQRRAHSEVPVPSCSKELNPAPLEQPEDFPGAAGSSGQRNLLLLGGCSSRLVPSPLSTDKGANSWQALCLPNEA